MARVLQLVAFLLVAATLARPAYAYLDPGTGSMLLQLLLGGVAGILVVAKLYWLRLKTFLGFASPESAGEAPAETSDEGLKADR